MSIGERFVDLLKRIALGIVFTPAMKARVISKLNEKVNIPLIGEDEERELFELIYEAVEEAIRDALKET